MQEALQKVHFFLKNFGRWGANLELVAKSGDDTRVVKRRSGGSRRARSAQGKAPGLPLGDGLAPLGGAASGAEHEA